MFSQNNKNKGENINPFFEQVLSILDLSEEEKEKLILEQQKTGVNNTINSILAGDKSNKQLVIFLIQESSDNFYKIDKKYYNNLDIGKVLMKSFIREGKEFLEIEDIIKRYFPKFEEKLLKIYEINLKKSDNIYTRDINKSLIYLKNDNIELYKKLLISGLINNKGDKFLINEEYIKNISLEIFNDNFLKLDIEAQQLNIINFLESIFGIKLKDLDTNSKYIFDNIINLINSEKYKLQLKNKKEEENNSEDIEEENNNEELIIDDKNSNQDLEFCDLVDFASPECNSYPVSGGYNLQINSGRTIFISEKEKQNFTSKALANFVKFYNTLYNLGLNFLWDKYSISFITLANNRFGFNYTLGEGITESKTLSVLNMIGKNIGIPEKEIIVESKDDNNVKKESGCFKTLGDALILFKEIKETGIINGKQYSDNGSFSKTAVENKLIESFCIDEKGNGLNISSWK